MASTRLRGRQAEARDNDRRILDAALAAFCENPSAPISAVADRAGVGQASLYRRFASKEALLERVCSDGMGRILAAAELALAEQDPHDGLVGFLRWYLDSGTLRLAGLLGSFEPGAHLFVLAHEANEAMQALVEGAQAAGAIRADVTGADLTLLLAQLATLDRPDRDRTAALRRRYLTLVIQGLTRRDAPALPGPAPDGPELEAPWRERAGPV